MSDFINLPILFLDYDGVLHPDEVYDTKEFGLILNAPGMHLFEYVGHLEEILNEYPDVHIVLSTSWVRAFGFDEAKSYLPESIQGRVIGGTFHRRESLLGGWSSDWPMYTRYQQIQQWLSRKFVASWVALDNDAVGWPADKADFLVHTDDWKGLSEEASKQRLRERLDFIVKDWQLFNREDDTPSM